MGDEDLLGDCWSLVRPRPDTLTESTQIDSLVPRAEWFWSSVQRLCVPECCGLDAYDFSAASVAWACGWGAERPGRDANGWRCEHPGDPHALAGELRQAAASIRAIDAPTVDAGLFNEAQTPEAYALRMEDLEAKVEAR